MRGHGMNIGKIQSCDNFPGVAIVVASIQTAAAFVGDASVNVVCLVRIDRNGGQRCGILEGQRGIPAFTTIGGSEQPDFLLERLRVVTRKQDVRVDRIDRKCIGVVDLAFLEEMPYAAIVVAAPDTKAGFEGIKSVRWLHRLTREGCNWRMSQCVNRAIAESCGRGASLGRYS